MTSRTHTQALSVYNFQLALSADSDRRKEDWIMSLYDDFDQSGLFGGGLFEHLKKSPFSRWLALETTQHEVSLRLLDLIAPLAKGMFGLVSSPPQAGKSTLVHQVANAIGNNHPECKTVVLLFEPTSCFLPDSWNSNVQVISTDLASSKREQIDQCARVFQDAKCVVEHGEDAVIMIDGLNLLIRSLNIVYAAPQRMTGDEPRGWEFARRLMRSAGDYENGGSLTVLATTGDQTIVDRVILDDFRRLASMQVCLNGGLAQQQLWPAIDFLSSGSRLNRRFEDPSTEASLGKLRRALVQTSPAEALQGLLKQLHATPSNAELLARIK